MKNIFYLFLIISVVGCSSLFNRSESVVNNHDKVLLVKDLMDTIFQKEELLKRYVKFNKNDTVYIKMDSVLGVNKKWNKVNVKSKHQIIVVDTTDKYYFKFLKLNVKKNTLEIEMISESTGNIIVGKAKLNDKIWDLNEINSGIR